MQGEVKNNYITGSVVGQVEMTGGEFVLSLPNTTKMFGELVCQTPARLTNVDLVTKVFRIWRV